MVDHAQYFPYKKVTLQIYILDDQSSLIRSLFSILVLKQWRDFRFLICCQQSLCPEHYRWHTHEYEEAAGILILIINFLEVLIYYPATPEEYLPWLASCLLHVLLDWFTPIQSMLHEYGQATFSTVHHQLLEGANFSVAICLSKKMMYPISILDDKSSLTLSRFQIPEYDHWQVLVWLIIIAVYLMVHQM